MDPLLLSVLAQAGGGLLSALFGESNAQKLQDQVNAQEQLKKFQIGQVQNLMKPTQPQYINPYASQLGTSTMQAIMGNLANRMGPDLLAKWGINPAVTPQSGLSTPAVAAEPQAVLLRKYGLTPRSSGASADRTF